MRKTLKVTIPEPCHENWSQMTPVEKGRFCKSCSKTVHDFTDKTDEQIVKSFLENQSLCGRFKSGQLNKELVYSRKTTNSYRTLLASSLFSFLSFGAFKAFSQVKPETVQTDSVKQTTVKGKHAISVLNDKIVSGTILDENGFPLPGVNIIIKGSSIGTQTDFDGNFKLKAKLGDIISFSFVGYKTEEKIIGIEPNYNFNLEVDNEIFGEVVITGMFIADESYNQDYGYIQNGNYKPEPSPEELERERIRKLRRKNYVSFYKRKNKEERTERKANRKK